MTQRFRVKHQSAFSQGLRKDRPPSAGTSDAFTLFNEMNVSSIGIGALDL